MAHKLLLADDSITIQKVVELTLSEEDFDVTAVGDGDTALATAKKLLPDIILADVFMPNMDGYELCGKLKEDPALKDTPVILLVSTFDNFDEARAAKVGASGHLTKPFESADLISSVKRLVEKRKAAPAVIAAEPVEEAVFAEEVLEAAPSDTDDLWSVVDMASDDQPLAGATETLTEDDLWKRANIVPDSEEVAAFPMEEEALPWDELPAEPFAEAEAMEDAGTAGAAAAEERDDLPYATVEKGPDPEATAILNMDDLGLPFYGKEVAAVELAEVSEPSEILPFENLEEATVAGDLKPAPAPAWPDRAGAPAAQPALAALSQDMIRDEVYKAVGDILDKKIKEALAGLSRDMVERVVWEVVPGLAEEMLVKEIGGLVEKKISEALAGLGKDKMEQVVWEVVPGLAEEILVKEIDKLKTGIG